MTFSIIELEDNYILNPEDWSVHRPGLYPSEASVEYELDGRRVIEGKCARAVWYRVMGVQVPPTQKVGLQQKASLGKWDEIGTVNRWKEMGVWVQNAVKFFNKEYILSGELDCIVKDPTTGNRIGYEIKTFYDHYANKEICGSKRPPVPGKPKAGQFLQSVLYSYEYQGRLDEYRMYYLERGDGHRVEFRVGTVENTDGTHQCYWEQIEGKYWSYFEPGKVLQPYTIENVYERYTKIISAIRTKQLPPKDFERVWDDATVEWMHDHGKLGKTKYEDWCKSPKKNPVGNWECSYCEFSNQCMQDDLTS